MTKVELPLLEALELASPLLPKSLLTRQLRIQQSLLQGRKLYQAYQEAIILAPEQLRLLDLGESSEQIAYAFQRIANYQLQQVQRDRQRLQDFLQPFFMVLVALMVRASPTGPLHASLPDKNDYIREAMLAFLEYFS